MVLVPYQYVLHVAHWSRGSYDDHLSPSPERSSETTTSIRTHTSAESKESKYSIIIKNNRILHNDDNIEIVIIVL
jgi:hypothetical protein